jgi:hypothetical protein
MSITYIYCKRNPNVEFMIMMIFKVKAIYFIWVEFFQIVLYESFSYALVGLVVGHLYIYFKDILPISHGKQFLRTPFFLEKFGEKIFGINEGEQPRADNNNQNRNFAFNNRNNDNRRNERFQVFEGRGMRIG